MLKPGDYIYGVATNSITREVTIKRAVVSIVHKRYVVTNVRVSGFGFDYQYRHPIQDVFLTAEDALWAYREQVVRLVLLLQADLKSQSNTLMSIDGLLSVGVLK